MPRAGARAEGRRGGAAVLMTHGRRGGRSGPLVMQDGGILVIYTQDGRCGLGTK